jgi:hypothetical protein
MWGTANGAVEPFTFFLESQETVYTSKYTVERATIALVLNTTYLTVKEAVVNTKTMYTKWHSFASFQTQIFQLNTKTYWMWGRKNKLKT